MSSNTSNTNNITNELNSIKKTVNELRQAYYSVSKLAAKLSVENIALREDYKNIKMEVTDLNQYGRRPSIEILNIKETIPQQQLENYVIEFLKLINVNVTSYDIVAVHRLGKVKPGKNRSVVLRFVNRKNAILALRNKKKAREVNNQEYRRLFVVENLCPFNKQLFNKLYGMKMRHEINSVWSFNGKIYCKFEENDEKILITSFDDIDDLFREYDPAYDEYDPYRTYDFNNSVSSISEVSSNSVSTSGTVVEASSNNQHSPDVALPNLNHESINNVLDASHVTDNRARRSRSFSERSSRRTNRNSGGDRRSRDLFF